jgi:hypothetical protein
MTAPASAQAHEGLKATGTQLQQAAARLSRPTVAPTPTPLPPPHPAPESGRRGRRPLPAVAVSRHDGGPHEETSSAMPPTDADRRTPPIDPKGF